MDKCRLIVGDFLPAVTCSVPPLYKDWVVGLHPKTRQFQLAVGQQAGSKEGMGGELGGGETLQINNIYFLPSWKYV